MGDSGASGGDIFDLKRIKRLVELMNEHDLSELDLRQSDLRIRLRRGQEPVITQGGRPQPAPATASLPAATTSGSPAVDDKLLTIKSPMVGTYYAASSPDSPPFVKIGDRVGPESTVCIIEAMKVFNDIPAEVSGKITAVLVESGEPVEFGQPLFKVDPT